MRDPDFGLSDSTAEQNFTLGAIIYGDQVIRKSALEEAIAYSAAGAQVHVLYFDTDTRIDVVQPGIEPCCGVPHASDLLFTMNFIENYFFEKMLPWGEDTADFMAKQFDSILKTGFLKTLITWMTIFYRFTDIGVDFV